MQGGWEQKKSRLSRRLAGVCGVPLWLLFGSLPACFRSTFGDGDTLIRRKRCGSRLAPFQSAATPKGDSRRIFSTWARTPGRLGNNAGGENIGVYWLP